MNAGSSGFVPQSRSLDLYHRQFCALWRNVLPDTMHLNYQAGYGSDTVGKLDFSSLDIIWGFKLCVSSLSDLQHVGICHVFVSVCVCVRIYKARVHTYICNTLFTGSLVVRWSFRMLYRLCILSTMCP